MKANSEDGAGSMISPPKSDLKKKVGIKNTTKRPVKSGSAAGGWKSLKFDKGKREGGGMNTVATPAALGTIPAAESDMLQHENTILTNDLISANREMQKLKIEHRQMAQKVGKMEKERVSV